MFFVLSKQKKIPILRHHSTEAQKVDPFRVSWFYDDHHQMLLNHKHWAFKQGNPWPRFVTVNQYVNQCVRWAAEPWNRACICWSDLALHLPNVPRGQERAPLLCCQSSCMHSPLVHTDSWNTIGTVAVLETNRACFQGFPSDAAWLNTAHRPDHFLCDFNWFLGLFSRLHWNGDYFWRGYVCCEVFISQDGCLLRVVHVLHERHAAF